MILYPDMDNNDFLGGHEEMSDHIGFVPVPGLPPGLGGRHAAHYVLES